VRKIHPGRQDIYYIIAATASSFAAGDLIDPALKYRGSGTLPAVLNRKEVPTHKRMPCTYREMIN
jgi:hypothetical protein